MEIYYWKKKEIKRAYHSPIFSLTKIIDSKCSCNVYFKIVTFYYHINVAQQWNIDPFSYVHDLDFYDSEKRNRDFEETLNKKFQNISIIINYNYRSPIIKILWDLNKFFIISPKEVLPRSSRFPMTTSTTFNISHSKNG